VTAPVDDPAEQSANTDRGQALTLEAIVASLILLTAVGFALQMTAVTPLSASTSSQHLENQLNSIGEGVLSSAAENGDLKRAVLYWENETVGFHGTHEERQYYTSQAPPGGFGDTLESFYGDRNIAYNVNIHYNDAGNVTTQEMVVQGEPSDNAVSASRTIVLVDSDRIVEADFSRGDPVVDADFYAPNGDNSTSYFNVFRVEVVAWRI
jgi:hypothetical protein